MNVRRADTHRENRTQELKQGETREPKTQGKFARPLADGVSDPGPVPCIV